ncbi:MAG: IS1595 family transposase [Proteobacteria bacterium]|nr:IS1595 family transposase [Pseudomonadota bacterium]
MAKGEINNKVFHDEAKARQWLEAQLWPDGTICPECGTVDNATSIATRKGWYQCNTKECRKQFSVTVGTLFERSHIPLNKWLLVAFLMCASKKGISTHQLHRMIGVSYKSTWFMTHRLREAMREGKFPGGLGGANKVVEADETYVGGKSKNRKRKVPPKEAVVSLVERDGLVRSFHVPSVSAKTLRPILVSQIDRASYLMTDEAGSYVKVGREFVGHGTVNHSIQEYVRGGFWHTNTVENYFSILKRGITGTYHHVSQQHLKRYLAEFDFRYNERSGLGVSDAERTAKMLRGIVGKRLTYRRAGETTNA